MKQDLQKTLGHKLKNVIDVFDDDQMLFIGCQTAFFFIGTKNEFKTFVMRASADKKTKLIKQVCDAKQKIENCMEEINAISFSEKEIPIIGECAHKIWRYCGNYISGMQQLDVFLGFEDRTVKEAYIRDPVEPNEKEIVLKVSGQDYGLYWTRNEWLADNRKN